MILKINKYEPQTPLEYWQSGGLQMWSLVPKCAIDLMEKIDDLLDDISPNFRAFVDVGLVKLQKGIKDNG